MATAPLMGWSGMSDPLPGRDDDLAFVRHFVDAAMVDGGALLVTGDPGSGKTAMLTAAARRASAIGARILRTEGDAAGGVTDYQAMDQLLMPLHADIAVMPTAPGAAMRSALGLAGGPVPDPLHVCHALLEVLLAAGDRRPLLVL